MEGGSITRDSAVSPVKVIYQGDKNWASSGAEIASGAAVSGSCTLPHCSRYSMDCPLLYGTYQKYSVELCGGSSRETSSL